MRRVIIISLFALLAHNAFSQEVQESEQEVSVLESVL